MNVNRLTRRAQHAIALTLKDLDDGTATLWGREVRFDTQTGARLPVPRRVFEVFDRDERPGLPDGWRELFAEQGWIVLGAAPNGFTLVRWVVTDAGREQMAAWLPTYLKGRQAP